MKCVFCDALVSDNGINHLTCPVCGEFNMSANEEARIIELFKTDNQLYKKRYLFSGFIRNKNIDGVINFEVTKEKFLEVFYSGILPQSIFEKMDFIISRIYDKTTYFGEDIIINYDNNIEYYSANEIELQSLINALKDNGYIRNGKFKYAYCITHTGAIYVEMKKNKKNESKQCFVAMWFTEEMKDIFHETITNTLEMLGYKALIISMVEHNENITDKIIAEIRKSKFVIADFSGNRGGVYFEAGFALGLDKPVIWTCNEKYFNKNEIVNITGKDPSGKSVTVETSTFHKIHFDIDHYNFIVWNNKEDLAEQLRNRIEATIK